MLLMYDVIEYQSSAYVCVLNEQDAHTHKIIIVQHVCKKDYYASNGKPIRYDTYINQLSFITMRLQ